MAPVLSFSVLFHSENEDLCGASGNESWKRKKYLGIFCCCIYCYFHTKLAIGNCVDFFFFFLWLTEPVGEN
jgi:hypothetical protein